MAERTLQSDSRKNLISLTFKVSSLFVAGLLVASCGNKNNDNPAPAPVIQPFINPTCAGGVNGTNCVIGGGAEIYRGDSVGGWMSSGIQASLVFLATQYNNGIQPQYPYTNGYNNGYPNTTMYPNGYNNGLNPSTYSGPVTVQGQLNVTSTGMWGASLLPQGGYQLVTEQPGQWIGATFQNVKVRFAGGSMTFTGTLSGYVGAKNSFQWGYTWGEVPRQGSIVGQIIIETVNGQQYYNVLNF